MFSMLLVFLSSNYFKGIFPFVRTKDTPTAIAFPRQDLKVEVGMVFERIPFKFRSPHSQILESLRIWRKSKSYGEIFNLANFFWTGLSKKYTYRKIYICLFHQGAEFSMSKEKWISVASNRAFPFQSNNIKE